MQPTGFPDETLDGSQTTEERLLAAAMEVYSREGIAKATTREIAKAAGVNEVTLFRKFQTKQGLLAAVLERAFLPSRGGPAAPSIAGGATLREVLHHFAAGDFDRKRRNVPLMRVLVAEGHRLGHHKGEIYKRIFQPWKDELASQIKEARERGIVREDTEPAIVVDQLVAMIFVGAMRAEQGKTDYAPETYLAACVETIARAITRETGKQ